ncbi:MAG: hypothetical protein RLZZ136_814 [Pseudomonadota bacterium]
MGVFSASHSSGRPHSELRGAEPSGAGLWRDDPRPSLYSVPGVADRDESVQQNGSEGRQLYLLANLIAAIDTHHATKIAARLLDQFGSLSGVLDASAESLSAVANDNGLLAHLIRFSKATIREGLVEEFVGATVSHANTAFLKFVISTIGPLRHEALLAVYLDGHSRYIGREIVARGSQIGLLIETRRLLRSAVERNAYGLIIAHNHPGGTPHPSKSDVTATESAKHAANMLGIKLCDHLIVAGQAIYSMGKAGML